MVNLAPLASVLWRQKFGKTPVWVRKRTGAFAKHREKEKEP